MEKSSQSSQPPSAILSQLSQAGGVVRGWGKQAEAGAEGKAAAKDHSDDSRGNRSSTRSNSSASPTSNSVPTKDKLSFTFIDHNDSFQPPKRAGGSASGGSGSGGGGSTSESRRAIRSHVMRDVRRRERLAGTKRPTRRDDKKGSAAGQSSSKKADSKATTPSQAAASEESGKASKARSRSSTTTIATRTPPASIASKSPSRQKRISNTGESPDPGGGHSSEGALGPTLPLTPLSPKSKTLRLSDIDPFCTLPGGVGESARVDRLIKHCASVFIPMTFPVEKGKGGQMQLRMEGIFASAMLRPAVFHGYMCMFASHRSMLQAKASGSPGGNEDYFLMKSKCITSVNEMLLDPKRSLSDDAIEIVVLLETATGLLGLFAESFMHLRASRKMCQLRGGVNPKTFAKNPALMHSLLISDVKCSVAMLSRPAFPQPWVTKPISSDFQSRIRPPPSSSLHTFSTSFESCMHLGPEILQILDDIRLLAWIDDLNERDDEGLSAADHETYRLRTYESEHALLSYPYRHLPPEIVSIPDPMNPPSIRPLDPIESIVRVASLLYINCSGTNSSDPSSGLARALVGHLIGAFSFTPWEQIRASSQGTQDVILWALIMGAYGSWGYPEQAFFEERMVNLAVWRGWSQAEDMKCILQGCLYLEARHGKLLEFMWRRVQAQLSMRREAAAAAVVAAGVTNLSPTSTDSI